MKIIEPTPSQAAAVLKKYLQSQGLETTLSIAQDGLAKTKGYVDWNALVSVEDPRGRKSKASSREDKPKQESRESEPSQQKRARPELVAPFYVTMTGMFENHQVDTYERALAYAKEVCSANNLTDYNGFNDVEISNARYELVTQVIRRATRYRLYVNDELHDVYGSTFKLHQDLIDLRDDNLALRVLQFELEDDSNWVGVCNTPEPKVHFEFVPQRELAFSGWQVRTVDGRLVVSGEDNHPWMYRTLFAFKAWLRGKYAKEGISADAVFTPVDSLRKWRVQLPGHPEKTWFLEEAFDYGNQVSALEAF